jgi:hypothetical protein
VLTFIVPPPDDPQIAASKPPQPPSPARPSLDWLDERILDVIRESEPVKTWSVINWVAVELSPGSRAEGRDAGLKLLARVRRLIRVGLLFRAGRNAIATFKPAPKPAGTRTARRKRTVKESAFKHVVSPPIPTGPPERENPADQVQRELVKSDSSPNQQSTEAEIVQTGNDSERIRKAARQLSRLPRRPKRVLSGWINESVRSYRNLRVRLASGQQVYVFGALRGRVVVTREPNGDAGDPFSAGTLWFVLPAAEVEVVRNADAVFLGSLKAGIKERPSLLKQESARRNRLQPLRPGRRRGRPPKAAK